MVALLGTKQQHLLGSNLTLPKIYDHLPPPSPDYFVSLGLPACVHRHLSYVSIGQVRGGELHKVCGIFPAPVSYQFPMGVLIVF